MRLPILPVTLFYPEPTVTSSLSLCRRSVDDLSTSGFSSFEIFAYTKFYMEGFTKLSHNTGRVLLRFPSPER